MSEEYIKNEDNQLPREIIDKPYQYINNYMEEILPYTGGKAFEILSLVPPSLIIPDLKAGGQTIRTNINTLFLSPSGSGKSSVSQKLRDLTYNPLDIRSITPAQMISKIQESPFFSLIVEDFHTMSQDEILIKIIEGMLGEEKRIQRETRNGIVDEKVEGIGLICGTPDDLAGSLQGGLVFRLVPLIIMHSVDEHSDIGYRIAIKMGEDDDKSREMEKNIKNYYAELMKIQEGEHDSINKIVGYHIDNTFKERAHKKWDNATRNIRKKTQAPLNWFRSLQEFYRFLLSSAFLNVFNRKVENGILHPNEEDYQVAEKLMKKDLDTKYRIIKMRNFVKRTNTIKELSSLIENESFNEYEKQIAKNLFSNRNKKKAKT